MLLAFNLSAATISKPVATVNLIRNEVITRTELDNELQNYKDQGYQDVTESDVLEALINEKVFLQGAERDGFIVSILVTSLVSWSGVWVRLILRIALLPVIMGISYELIRYAGGHDNILTVILSAPGKALQLVTTAEPDDDMLEVAIESLKLVLPDKEGADRW